MRCKLMKNMEERKDSRYIDLEALRILIYKKYYVGFQEKHSFALMTFKSTLKHF